MFPALPSFPPTHPEMVVLKGELENTAVHSLNGVDFSTGQLQGHEVVLFLSGISIVNAAMTVQLALDHFNIKQIVFSGIAGAARTRHWTSLPSPGESATQFEITVAVFQGTGLVRVNRLPVSPGPASVCNTGRSDPTLLVQHFRESLPGTSPTCGRIVVPLFTPLQCGLLRNCNRGCESVRQAKGSQ